MFASTASRNSFQGFASAYRSIGVETGVSSASPHRLVAMLFDGFQDAVAQARGALACGDTAGKGRAVSRAARIVEEGLKAGLNLKDGGKLAADLDALYGYVSLRLTHANLHNSDAALEECSRLIEPVRSAWTAIAGQAAANVQ